MGCCIAIAFVIALVRKAWFAVTPGRAPDPVTFAPVAFRAAPGSAPQGSAAPGGTLAVAQASSSRLRTPHGRSAVAMGLGAVAATSAFYAAVVAVLGWTGATTPIGQPAVSWAVRDIVVAAIGILAIVAAAVLYRGPAPRRQGLGAVVTGAGIAWFGLGVLDMHGFAMFDLADGSLVADALFHGPGLLAIAVGIGLLTQREHAPAARRLEMSPR